MSKQKRKSKRKTTSNSKTKKQVKTKPKLKRPIFQTPTVEDKGDHYLVGFVSRILNDYNKLVSKHNVLIFAEFLMNTNTEMVNEFDVNKIELQSFIGRNLAQTGKYEITIKGSRNKEFPERHRLYATLFREGVHKKYYYQYYNLPLKVLEFYGCVTELPHTINVNMAKTMKFVEKKLVKYGE